jgi:HEAT repeat protein
MDWAKHMMKKKIIFSTTSILILFGIALAYMTRVKFFHKEKILSCNINEGNLFNINYLSNGMSDLSLFQSSKQQFKIFFTGQIQETCLENNTNFLSYLIDFKKSKVLLDNQEISQITNTDQMSPQNVYVKVSKKGVLAEIKFSKYLDPFLANIYRDYISNSFINFTHFYSEKMSWENSVNNYSGKIAFKYSYIDDSKIQRKFINIENFEKSYLVEETKKVNKFYANESNSIFELSEKNIPLSIDIKRIATSYLNKKKIGIEETIFSKKIIQNEGSKVAIMNINPSLFQTPEFYTTDLSAKEVEQRLKEKTLLQNSKYSSFNEFLMKSDLKQEDHYTDYFLQLKSLFSLKSDSISEAVPFLIKNMNSNDKFNLILSALVSSGSIQAQRSLIETYPLLTDTKTKIVLLANLATVENPSLETEEFVKSQWKESDHDIRNTAVLAMGNIGKNIQEPEAQRYNNIYHDLLSELQSAKSVFEKQVALLALGNLSDRRSLQNIYKETLSSNEEIRKSAAFALRFLNLPEPDKYLGNILTNDTSDSVRLSALEALSYRKSTPEILNIEKNILRNDPSENLRMQTLKNLAQIGNKSEIEYASKNDSSKSVRTYAENLLIRYQMNL